MPVDLIEAGNNGILFGRRIDNIWTKLPADLLPQVSGLCLATTHTTCLPLSLTLIYWFGYVSSDHGGAVVSTPDPEPKSLRSLTYVPNTLSQRLGGRRFDSCPWCFFLPFSSSDIPGLCFGIHAMLLATLDWDCLSKTTVPMTYLLSQILATLPPRI